MSTRKLAYKTSIALRHFVKKVGSKFIHAMKCWGYKGHGQLGDGTNITRLEPVLVPNLTNVSSLTAGGYHTCVILTNGDKQCWGLNY